jgi:hypothetical protein
LRGFSTGAKRRFWSGLKKASSATQFLPALGLSLFHARQWKDSSARAAQREHSEFINMTWGQIMMNGIVRQQAIRHRGTLTDWELNSELNEDEPEEEGSEEKE